MQAVEIACLVLKKKRRRPLLTRVMAKIEIVLMCGRIVLVYPHAHIPPIGNFRKMRIERRTQSADHARERVSEVAVFAFAETMAGHHDVTAEMLFMRVERGDFRAFLRGQQIADHRAA